MSIKNLANGWTLLAVSLVMIPVLIQMPVHSQTNGAKPTSLPYVRQTRPIAIPATPTTIIAQDAYICMADLTATGQVITISDKQASPIAWITNTLGTGGSAVTWNFVASDASICRWMPGGVTWGANTTGASGYLVVKCAVGPCNLVSGL